MVFRLIFRSGACVQHSIFFLLPKVHIFDRQVSWHWILPYHNLSRFRFFSRPDEGIYSVWQDAPTTFLGTKLLFEPVSPSLSQSLNRSVTHGCYHSSIFAHNSINKFWTEEHINYITFVLNFGTFFHLCSFTVKVVFSFWSF